MGVYGNAEPLLTDARLTQIEDQVRRNVKGLDDTTFVTAKVHPTEPHPAEAHFLLLTLHPRPLQRAAGQLHGTVIREPLSQWESGEKDRGHFVTDADPALRYFAALATQHTAELQNFRDMQDRPEPT